MHDRPGTILLYAAGASVAAITLFYILGPSISPDVDSFSTRKPGAIGLSNPANDCFINSVLQALAGLSGLRRHLEIEVQKSGKRSVEDEPTDGKKAEAEGANFRSSSQAEKLRAKVVTQALKQVLDQLNEQSPYKKTISATNFIHALEYAFENRINRRQQDAQELLQHVAERLCDEYHAGLKILRNAQDATSQVEDPVDQPVHREQAEGFGTFSMEGKLESQIECQTCRFRPKPSVSSFVTLTLTIPHHSQTSLDACFDGLLKPEVIDDYRCDRCRLTHAIEYKRRQLSKAIAQEDISQLQSDISEIEKAVIDDPEAMPDLNGMPDTKQAPRQRISKHLRIAAFPNVLAIHLSRSIFDPSSFSSKNMAKVMFAESLVLGGFEMKHYKLACVVTHRGGHDSGHYETFRRQADTKPEPISEAAELDGNGRPHPKRSSSKRKKRRIQDRWWRISDDKVGECRTPDVLDMQKEVYLLFYERCQDAAG